MAPNKREEFDLDEAQRQWDSGNPKVVNGVFEELRRLRSTLGARVVKNLTEKVIDVERQRDAAVAKLTPNIKKLVAEDGELTMTLDDPYKITAIIARSLRDLVETEGGLNYAEMSFKEAGVFKPIVVAVAKSAEQTPHALRLKAERERDDASHERDELLAARIAYASEFPPAADGEPDVGSVHENIRKLKAETKQQRTLLAAMRQSCLAWFDNPNGPWGWECVACGAQFTKGSGPGQPPSETRAYAELVHDADCIFHPTPRLPSSSDEDLP